MKGWGGGREKTSAESADTNVPSKTTDYFSRAPEVKGEKSPERKFSEPISSQKLQGHK